MAHPQSMRPYHTPGLTRMEIIHPVNLSLSVVTGIFYYKLEIAGLYYGTYDQLEAYG